MEKQSEDKLVNKPLSSGHGSGDTFIEEPNTFEHIHDVEGSEVTEKDTLDKHMEVKGDSLIPEKIPAAEFFTPTTSLKVMPLTTGNALRSNLSSG